MAFLPGVLGPIVGTACVLLSFVLVRVLRHVNSWLFEPSLGASQPPLPPGDFGWPLLGNMLSFLRAFKGRNPDSFIQNYIKRYSRRGLYKAFMFGRPTILATTPEACKFVLMNDENFVTGWPKSTQMLMGRKSFTGLDPEEHRRLRKLTMAPVNGPEAFKKFLPRIEVLAINTLAKWAEREKPWEMLPQLKQFTFNIIADVFLSYEPGPKCHAIEREYSNINKGVRAMAINLPGFAFYKALKSRKRIVELLQMAIDERRALKGEKVDVLQDLLLTKDEQGNNLTDEEIIDVLVMYLNAGHESSAHSLMWTFLILKAHPHVFETLKEEQVQIRKEKPSGEKLLTLDDYRKMKYMSKVIDEVLRVVNISPMIFRKSIKECEFEGCTIPKGWAAAAWMRQVHMDPEVYPEPTKFDPDRWDEMASKLGPTTFIPFGAGSHLCVGNFFAKLEMSVLIHHMILYYRFEPMSMTSPTVFLPHPHPKDNCRAQIYKI